MIVIKNKLIPFGRYKIINLCGVLFVKGNTISPEEYNHENIHTRQMIEMLFIFFYIWYGIEWLIRLIQYKNGHTAYRNISFEKEAYKFEGYLSYLKERERFAMWKI